MTKKKKRVLDINFNLLVKDIEELLKYMQNIIIYDNIKEKHYMTHIDYQEILINYNKVYRLKKYQSSKMVNNLLDFYIKKIRIENEMINKYEPAGYLEIKYNVDGLNKQNEVLKFAYICFIKDMYSELEEIFIKSKLEEQIRSWQKRAKFKSDFEFKTMAQLKNIKDNYLKLKLERLEKDVIELMKEANISIDDEILAEFINKDVIELMKEANISIDDEILNEYLSFKSEKTYIEQLDKSKFGITSYEEALLYVEDMIEEIYRIRYYFNIV